MLEFFSVNTVAFTILGYPMSYVELFGTFFNLWSVWLVARNHIATWPIGIVGVLLFLALFYQINLYADVLEQVYYLGMSFFGWWQWARGRNAPGANALTIQTGSLHSIGVGIAITLVLSLALGYLISSLHIFFPTLFAEPASYPYIDALTTMMSFTATFLMAYKRVECWYYWILVDVIGIWLYYVKDVKFVSLLYVVFLLMACNGLVSWLRAQQSPSQLPSGHPG